jgi:hypothetical protein
MDMKGIGKRKVLAVLALALFSILFLASVSFVSAYTSVSGSHGFYYLNGTSFQNPGNWENITLVDNVWYFDGVAYPPVSPSPSPTATTTVDHAAQARTEVTTNIWIAISFLIVALLVVAAMGLKNATENPDSAMDTSYTIIVISIVLIIAIVILVALLNAFG